jgi:hypothetical protein
MKAEKNRRHAEIWRTFKDILPRRVGKSEIDAKEFFRRSLSPYEVDFMAHGRGLALGSVGRSTNRLRMQAEGTA